MNTNERGFFTIVGLCLLVIVAISIKGVHEFEANYSRGVTNFQAEHELQNAADSALITAIENESTVTQNFNSKKFGTIKVEIRCKPNPGGAPVDIRRFERIYSSSNKFKDIPLNKDGTLDNGGVNSATDETPEAFNKATIWLSVASCDSPFIVGKIYRRSFAYVDENNTVHYLNNL